MDLLPARTLWVWERREDLSNIDPRTTAIATLDRTIFLGHTATVIPRRQPFIYPPGIKRISVIRIEAPGDIAPGLERATAALVLNIATSDPTIAALQIDFDARRSQRAFYARLLHDLRRGMPPTLPLSITSLASWCSSDDWLSNLPIDEAVPMFFRMGYRESKSMIVESRECTHSIGLSTDESWPDHRPAGLHRDARIYVFNPHPWTSDDYQRVVRRVKEWQ